jgi:diguanylate cyclase (GGDEF)-like protein
MAHASATTGSAIEGLRRYARLGTVPRFAGAVVVAVTPLLDSSMFTTSVALVCAVMLLLTDVLVVASRRFNPSNAQRALAYSVVLDFMVMISLITDLNYVSAPGAYMGLMIVGLEAGLLFRMRGLVAFTGAFVAVGWAPFAKWQWQGYPVSVAQFLLQGVGVIVAAWIAASVAEEAERRRWQAAHQAGLNEALSVLARELMGSPQHDEVMATLSTTLGGFALPWTFEVLARQPDGTLLGPRETVIDAESVRKLWIGSDSVILNPSIMADTERDIAIIRCQNADEVVAAIVVTGDGTNRFSDGEMEFFSTLCHQVCAALDRAALHDHVKELSLTDALTKLRNRRAFDERLAEEISRSDRSEMPLAMIMLDIDHFKLLNDTQGHPAGDRTLMQIGEVLQSPTLLRDIDLSYRLGGEEFGVLLPGTGLSGAVELAERLCKAVGETDFPDCSKQPLGHLTISAGVALHVPGCGDSGKALIEASDLALYEAKRSGRNCVRSAPPQLRAVDSISAAG